MSWGSKPRWHHGWPHHAPSASHHARVRGSVGHARRSHSVAVVTHVAMRSMGARRRTEAWGWRPNHAVGPVEWWPWGPHAWGWRPHPGGLMHKSRGRRPHPWASHGRPVSWRPHQGHGARGPHHGDSATSFLVHTTAAASTASTVRSAASRQTHA